MKIVDAYYFFSSRDLKNHYFRSNDDAHIAARHEGPCGRSAGVVRCQVLVDVDEGHGRILGSLVEISDGVRERALAKLTPEEREAIGV